MEWGKVNQFSEALKNEDWNFLNRSWEGEDLTPSLKNVISNGSLNGLRWLVDHGANIHHDDSRAFLDAIYDHHNMKAHYLISQGADLTAYGHAPLRYASKTNNHEMMSALVVAGARPEDAIRSAFSRGDYSSLPNLHYLQKHLQEQKSLTELASQLPSASTYSKKRF